MQLLNGTKRNMTNAMRHYMCMRLQFRGTVFSEAKLAESSPQPINAPLAQPTQTAAKH